MAKGFRPAPKKESAELIRAAFKAAGVSARVARKAYAHRIVTNEPEAALAILKGLGFAGPVGGLPVESAPGQFFAYEPIEIAA